MSKDNTVEINSVGEGILIVILALLITYVFVPWWLQLALGIMGYTVSFQYLVGVVMLLQGAKIALGIKSN